MVRQDFNRPSVMIWGYMNEIFLRRPYTEGKQLEDYYRFTEKVARALEATIREEDPSRYTMMLIIICLNITKTPIWPKFR